VTSSPWVSWFELSALQQTLIRYEHRDVECERWEWRLLPDGRSTTYRDPDIAEVAGDH
jgi:hypothetical protein